MNRYERITRVQPESYFMESYIQNLRDIMHRLTKFFHEQKVNFTFIGGAARNTYGAFRITDDIDLLIDVNDKSKMNNLPVGFINQKSSKKFYWTDPKTKIEVIYSGEISGDGVRGLEYPKPEEISVTIDGMPIIEIHKLVIFKLSAGLYSNTDRYKDFEDIQALIKANDLPIEFIEGLTSDVNIQNKYVELYNSTKKKDPIDN